MKTITEFAASTLKNAQKTREELIGSGKTPEELPAAMGEALKLEGDRLNHLLSALDSVGTKTTDLKRILVIALNEGEKAPSQAKQVGEQYFIVEYYPSLNPPKQARRGEEGRGEKRGRGKGKRGGKGRGDRDQKGRGPRPERAPRPTQGPEGAAKPERPLRLPVPKSAKPEGEAKS